MVICLPGVQSRQSYWHFLSQVKSGFILNSTEMFVAAELSVERKVQDEPAGEE
jgi:hypothetical protein